MDGPPPEATAGTTPTVNLYFNISNTFSVSIWGTSQCSFPSDPAASNTAVHETVVPGTAVPGTAMPGTAVPRTAMSRAAVPEPTASQPVSSESTVPERTAPKPAVPKPTAPTPTAPEPSESEPAPSTMLAMAESEPTRLDTTKRRLRLPLPVRKRRAAIQDAKGGGDLEDFPVDVEMKYY